MENPSTKSLNWQLSVYEARAPGASLKAGYPVPSVVLDGWLSLLFATIQGCNIHKAIITTALRHHAFDQQGAGRFINKELKKQRWRGSTWMPKGSRQS